MTLNADDLRQFTGSENLYTYRLLNLRLNYTDGVQYVAEQGGAYWLIDAILSHQVNPTVRQESFQVWKLQVSDNAAVLVCEDGNCCFDRYQKTLNASPNSSI